MTYKATKVDDQTLMFHIEADNNGESVTFKVVCASDESEIDSLVEHHLAFLNSPPPVPQPVPPTPDINTIVQQQQAMIETLTTRLAALEAK